MQSVDDYYNRVMVVVNSLISNGKDILDVEVIKNILRSFPSKIEYIVCFIEESNDLSTMVIEELVGSLQSHEHRMKQRESSITFEQVFHTQVNISSNFGRGRGARGRGRGRGRGSNYYHD